MNKFYTLTIALILALAMMFTLVSCVSEVPSNNSVDNSSHIDSESSTDSSTDKNNGTDSSVESSSGTDSSTDNSSGDSTSSTPDSGNEDIACSHTDADRDDYCDKCESYLVVIIDFYAINDLHGKFCDNDSQPGVDELGTFFEKMALTDDHMVILSSGDMWQGSAESVLTNGKIMVDWMNALGFVSMTLGNHEFDWGEDAIRENALLADFPFLAINVYNNSTGKRAEYCSASIMIDRGDIQIAVIGAIGDCYSSISSDMVEDVYFKTGNELTNLVKAEALRLRELGADIIVYSLHDGADSAGSSMSHYDQSLSDGYVDIVFEGHSHQAYVTSDTNGIVHIQGGGENYGLSHVEIAIHTLTGEKSVTAKNIITNGSYAGLEDHAPTEAIEDNYADIIDFAYATLGSVAKKYNGQAVADYVAELYLTAGLDKWGTKYDIVAGGGFLQTRSPYDLQAGAATYADILSLLPFNNRIVLCTVSGSKLSSQFINSTNKNYHVALKDGFASSSVQTGKTYYIVVDMYTALYRYNGLTIVDYYDEGVYARDLLAEAIKRGDLGLGNTTGEYTISSIQSALTTGDSLKVGAETTEFLYYKGKLSDFANTTYGNCYLTDENGTQIYVYGLKDQDGNRYDKMAVKPQEGDTVVICATIKKYQYPAGEIVIELTNSIVMEINP